MVSIALAAIVKNEEKVLWRCLSSLAGVVSEMIIMDTGSTDRTVEIAQSFGAKVGHTAWNNDFSAARNMALEKVSADWVLHLDADEYLPTESAAALKGLPFDKAELFRLRLVEESGGFLSLYPRLFRNQKEIRYQGRIHEHLSFPDKFRVIDTQIQIMHSGYGQSAVADKGKAERNVRIMRESLNDDPENVLLNFVYARELHRRGDPDALSFYEKAVKVNKGEVGGELYKFYATELASRGEHARALQIALQGMAIEPASIELIFLKGLLLLDLERPEDALASFNECLHRLSADGGPGSINVEGFEPHLAWRGIGMAYAKKGDIDRAVKGFAAAVKLEPKDEISRRELIGLLKTRLPEKEVALFLKQLGI